MDALLLLDARWLEHVYLEAAQSVTIFCRGKILTCRSFSHNSNSGERAPKFSQATVYNKQMTFMGAAEN
jgi:hypothetical protein